VKVITAHVCYILTGEIEAETDVMVIVSLIEVVVTNLAQFDMMVVLHR